MTKVKRTIPEWHQREAAEIASEYAAAHTLNEEARVRRARIGLMLIWVKSAGKADNSIPHGEFGRWLETNLPSLPRSTAGDYITEAKSICDLLGWQIGGIRHFETPPHALLEAKPETLTGDDKLHQKELLKVIDQQKQFRAVTQYKQVEIVDDATVPKRGRVAGEGGKRALTAAEKAVKTAAQANDCCKEMQALAVDLGAAFVALPDEDLEAHLHFLDTHIHAVKEWLKTPTTRRDVKDIVKLLKF